MWWWHGSGWGWLAMTVVMLGFWLVVGWLVVTLVRGESTGREDPEATLARRFAAGELSDEEYRSRLETLRAARRRPASTA